MLLVWTKVAIKSAGIWGLLDVMICDNDGWGFVVLGSR